MKQLERRSLEASASIRRDQLLHQGIAFKAVHNLFIMAVAWLFPRGKITGQTGGLGTCHRKNGCSLSTPAGRSQVSPGVQLCVRTRWVCPAQVAVLVLSY